MAQYKDVEMPDGSIVEFPSSMSQEAIDKVISKKFGKSGQPKINFQKPQSLKEKVMRYGIKNPLAGAAKSFDKIQNLPLKGLSAFNKKFGEAAKKYSDINYDEIFGLPEEKNLGDILTQGAPEIALGMALPGLPLGKFGEFLGGIPIAGKYAQKVASEALPQAALAGALSEPGGASDAALMAGATQAPFSILSQFMQSPLPAKQKLGAALLGTGGGALTAFGLDQIGMPSSVAAPASLAVGLLGNKLAGTKGMMMQELAGGKNLPKAEKRLQMANRLNLDFLTPEEAFNSPFLARKQGRLGRTEEGSEMMYEKFQNRVESEQNAINRLLKQIHDPEVMGPKATELYEQSYKYNLPDNLIADLSQDPVISHAINDVLKKPAYQKKLQDIPVENFAFWDQVKKALGDMAEGAPKEEASIINETRRSLVKQMDYISPEYKQARALEERKFARQGLEDVFDKSNIRSGHQFYKALNSQEDFDKLMHNLRDVPVARAKLKAMRELFKDFRKESTINKVRGLEQVGMKQNRNDIKELMTSLENIFTGGKFDKEGIEFITSKDWNKQLADINKISDKQKRRAKTIETFGKIAAQINAKKEQEELKNYR